MNEQIIRRGHMSLVLKGKRAVATGLGREASSRAACTAQRQGRTGRRGQDRPQALASSRRSAGRWHDQTWASGKGGEWPRSRSPEPTGETLEHNLESAGQGGCRWMAGPQPWGGTKGTARLEDGRGQRPGKQGAGSHNHSQNQSPQPPALLLPESPH